MLWTHADELGCTGSASTRWFQALSAGKIRQADASDGAARFTNGTRPAGPARPTPAVPSMRIRAAMTDRFRACVDRRRSEGADVRSISFTSEVTLSVRQG